MRPVVTVRSMRDIDREAIGGDVDTGYSYMVRAGEALAAAVRRVIPNRTAGDIAIVCGKGNNGGDGFVAGRLLMETGYGVMCFALCECSEIKGEARKAFDEYEEGNGSYLVLHDVADCGEFGNYILIIDALLGTGISGSPRGLSAELISTINASGKPVVAADTPSGLDNDTGMPGDPCVKASVTVTMGYPKIGTYFHPGRSHVGRIEVAELGYPEEAFRNHDEALRVPDIDDMRKMLPSRKPSGSKFDHGLALMICGSRGMTGSAVLASEAALRTGCGMAHLASPASTISSLSAHLVETVLHPIAETPRGTPSAKAFDALCELAQRMQVACIGPGVSHQRSASLLVRKLVAGIDKPIVLDADGINAFKGRGADLAAKGSDMVITPHRGEWARLFGALPPEPGNVVSELKYKAAELGITILLKGSPTIVATPDAEAYLLPYGNSALASAGTGDVLSGTIASLVAQGCKVPDAAVLGAFIHGMAGEFAAATNTEYGVIARDVVAAIPQVLRLLTGNNENGAATQS